MWNWANKIKGKKNYAKLHMSEISSKNKYFLFLKINFIYIKHEKKNYRWIRIISSKILIFFARKKYTTCSGAHVKWLMYTCQGWSFQLHCGYSWNENCFWFGDCRGGIL